MSVCGAGRNIWSDTALERDHDGAVAVPLLPKRVLELAKELSEPAVRSIKADQWGGE